MNECRVSDSGHFLFCNHLVSLWLLILGHFYELVCVVRLFVCVGSGDPAQGLVTFSKYSTTELYSESVLWFVVFSLWMLVVVYIFYGSCSMKRCQVAWGAGVCAVWCELFLPFSACAMDDWVPWTVSRCSVRRVEKIEEQRWMSWRRLLSVQVHRHRFSHWLLQGIWQACRSCSPIIIVYVIVITSFILRVHFNKRSHCFAHSL